MAAGGPGDAGRSGRVSPPDAGMGRGVLHQQAAASNFTLARYEPSTELTPFVDFYWVVRWDLRGRPAHEQAVLPHPNVNLGFEPGGVSIYGVVRKLFLRRLDGQGVTLGARFRAGGFRPFWTGPVAGLNDRVVPAGPLLGPGVAAARKLILAGREDEVLLAAAEQLLTAVRPAPDPVAERVGAMVARIVADPDLRRVDQLAAALDVPARRLQRLFSEYVGVSPKWVMRRARLHEVAERAERGDEIDWAELAVGLGYADQAHLTRDFTATIGVPPARYVTAGEGTPRSPATGP